MRKLQLECNCKKLQLGPSKSIDTTFKLLLSYYSPPLPPPPRKAPRREMFMPPLGLAVRIGSTPVSTVTAETSLAPGVGFNRRQSSPHRPSAGSETCCGGNCEIICARSPPAERRPPEPPPPPGPPCAPPGPPWARRSVHRLVRRLDRPLVRRPLRRVRHRSHRRWPGPQTAAPPSPSILRMSVLLVTSTVMVRLLARSFSVILPPARIHADQQPGEVRNDPAQHLCGLHRQPIRRFRASRLDLVLHLDLRHRARLRILILHRIARQRA